MTYISDFCILINTSLEILEYLRVDHMVRARHIVLDREFPLILRSVRILIRKNLSRGDGRRESWSFLAYSDHESGDARMLLDDRKFKVGSFEQTNWKLVQQGEFCLMLARIPQLQGYCFSFSLILIVPLRKLW